MRKKVKPSSSSMSPGAVEMVIKINNESVVVEVIPPTIMLNQNRNNDDSKNSKVPPPPSTDEDSGNNNNNNNKEEVIMDLISTEFTHPTTGEDSNASYSSDDRNQQQHNPDDRKLVHNKSEKLRRAQLKASMERLKLLVPSEDSTQKYTTASLLRKARFLIHKLEERERRNVLFKDQLMREQKYLKRRLEQVQLLSSKDLPAATTVVAVPPVAVKPKPPSQVVVAGTNGTKYPAHLPLSQSKPPPILKRKFNNINSNSNNNNSNNIEPDGSTSIFLVESASTATSAAAAGDLKLCQAGDISGTGTVPTTTYELLTSSAPATDHFSSSSENYCIIIDTGMLSQQGL